MKHKILLALAGIALFLLFKSCQEDNPLPNVEATIDHKGLTARSNTNNSGSPPDTFVYIPAQVAAKLIVTSEGVIPFKGHYLAAARRPYNAKNIFKFEFVEIPNIKFGDTTTIRYTDTFFICRRVKL